MIFSTKFGCSRRRKQGMSIAPIPKGRAILPQRNSYTKPLQIFLGWVWNVRCERIHGAVLHDACLKIVFHRGLSWESEDRSRHRRTPGDHHHVDSLVGRIGEGNFPVLQVFQTIPVAAHGHQQARFARILFDLLPEKPHITAQRAAAPVSIFAPDFLNQRLPRDSFA